MKKQTILVFALFCIAIKVGAQIKPVNVSVSCSNFTSVYIADLHSNAGKLTIDLLLNDFNETSWDVKLRISIQGNSVVLNTKPGFSPSIPATLFPGVTKTLSGFQLAEYLCSENLICTGISPEAFLNSPKLPEGNYQISIEVLDYYSGKPLSNTVLSNFTAILGTPPVPINPENMALIDPLGVGQINFTWQIPDPILSQPGLSIRYQLLMYEIIDPALSPEQAILQNMINPVFFSEAILNTFFSINPFEINLQQGKKYLYRIKVFEENGFELFQNNGLSIPYCFYYGLPLNGEIILINPPNNYALLKNDLPLFTWRKASNVLNGQNVDYILQIAENNNPSSPEIEQGSIILETSVGSVSSMDEISYVLNQELSPLKQYNWQVKAFTNGTEIAKSEIHSFTGPPLFEKFIAANMDIYVATVQNPDLEHFTGTGYVDFSGDQNSQNLNFENIVLTQNSGLYFMTTGQIFGKASILQPITINGANSLNPAATFVLDSFRISPYEFKIKGFAEIPFPHPTIADSLVKFCSESKWLAFNDGKVYGTLLLKSLQAKLLSPYDFSIETNPDSYIIFTGNNYILNINGKVLKPLPQISDTAAFFFQNQNNLQRINSSSIENKILNISEDFGFYLSTQEAVIDFDDNFSFFLNDSIPDWKGIILQNPIFKINSLQNSTPAFYLSQNTEIVLNSLPTPVIIGADGLWLNIEISSIPQAAFVNTFPSEITNFNIRIDPENDFTCSINSTILLPLLSENQSFPLQVSLMKKGYSAINFADSSILNTFDYNPENSDSKIEITVNSAEFFNNNSLQLEVNIEWAAISLSMQNLPFLTIMGNYDIGFLQPGGSINPPEQSNAQIQNYSLQCLSIGCGMSQGKYGFGINAGISMGDDISGPNGPPQINIYSVWENSLLPIDFSDEGSSFVPETDQEETNEYAEQINSQIQDMENLIISLIQNSNDSSEYIFSIPDIPSGDNNNLLLVNDSIYSTSNQDLDLNHFFATIEISIPESFSNTFTTLKNFCNNLNIDQQKAVADNLSNILEIAINNIVQQYIDQLDELILEKSQNFTNNLNNIFDNLFNNIQAQTQPFIDDIFQQIEQGLISFFANGTLDLSSVISQAVLETKNSIQTYLYQTIKQAFSDNMIVPLVSHLADGLRTGFQLYLRSLAYENIPVLLSGNFSEIDINPNEILDSIMSDFENSFNTDSLLLFLEKCANDFKRDIDPLQIFKEIKTKIVPDAIELIGFLANQLTDELNNLFQTTNFAQSLGMLAENSPLSFSGLNIRFNESGMPTGLEFDPTNISLTSRFIDLAGTIKHHKDHPVLGDCWIGDILLHVKIPSPDKAFSVRGIYLHGKTENYPFWFAQIEPGETAQPGMPVTPQAKPFESPLNLGPVNLVGACGRLGKNVEDIPGSGITPNNNIPFSAAMHLVFYDKPANGKNLRIEAQAQLQTTPSGDYSFVFEGNLQAKSPSPQLLSPDEAALAKGNLSLSYNSAEQHFLGTANAIIQSPALCASGSLFLSVKPDFWLLEIGSPDNRIIFVPGCSGWSPTGWLAINPEIISLGIGLSFSAMAQTPQPLGLAGYNITPFAGFSFAAGISAVIQYNPSIALLQAGIWAEAWAGIGAHWEKNGDSGTWTLAEANISGSATITFKPKPITAAGNLQGNVRVLCVNLPFSLGFSKSL